MSQLWNITKGRSKHDADGRRNGLNYQISFYDNANWPVAPQTGRHHTEQTDALIGQTDMTVFEKSRH